MKGGYDEGRDRIQLWFFIKSRIFDDKKKESKLVSEVNHWWVGWDDRTIISDEGNKILTLKNRRLIWADVEGTKFLTLQMDVENHGWNNIKNIEYRADQFLVNLKSDAPDFMHISIEYKIGSFKDEWPIGAMPIYCGAGVGSHCSASIAWNRDIPSAPIADDTIFKQSPYRVKRC